MLRQNATSLTFKTSSKRLSKLIEIPKTGYLQAYDFYLIIVSAGKTVDEKYSLLQDTDSDVLLEADSFWQGRLVI